jgi:hypothetical protein
VKPKALNAIHDALDGVAQPPAGSETETLLCQYREALGPLEKSRVAAPPDLAARIMGRLPSSRRRRFATLKNWLPAPRQWLAPALAGAALVMFALFAGTRLHKPLATEAETVEVHFELHAPGAHRVELVGTFNHWQPGTIRLQGPDASGHWEATVRLPEGRYEYQFLVDGRRWVTDPAAAVVRPDGFGQMNAVLEVSGEGITL